MSAPHVPVLLDEVMAGLALGTGDTYVDGTFGAGGYTRAALATGIAHAYAFDRDPTAIRDAFADTRLTLIEERFSLMDRALAERGVVAVDAIALDIGVSSMQIDRAERGFSVQSDGPLDMRMSDEGPTAADFVNAADESDIADVLYRYGEEPKSRRIARAIVAARPIERTLKLAETVRRAVGWHPGLKDPAIRAFQAIRIHINGELDELDAGLAVAERLLRPGGRLAVVTFHSLEDRAVKRFLRERSGDVPGTSRFLPEAQARGPAPTFNRVAKPVRAGVAELAANPRARSATLRSATRTDAPAWGTVR